ncbi:MAG: hypothetical protein ACRDTZ_01210 [Pseudonocardiaceae bacterium]
MNYDRDNLPDLEWIEYRKIGTTRMVPVTGPFTVVTKEGAYTVPDGWDGFLALDADGDPYPVAADVHTRSYERAS